MGALGEVRLREGEQGNGAVDLAVACLDDDEVEVEEEEEVEEVLDRGIGSGSGGTRAIEDAVKVLLQGLGEDCAREGLRKTPLRVAQAFRDGTRGYKQKADDIVQGALFPEAGSKSSKGLAGGAGGLVVVRDINLFSYCESCLLPFKFHCHVGYIPSGQRVVGLSKLGRVADVFAKRLQSPQRLADEVCSALHNSIKPAGVAVALQCWHLQFPEALGNNFHIKHPPKLDMQGWLQVHACSSSGVFADENSKFWVDFLSLLKLRGINMERNATRCSSIQCWCPSMLFDAPSCNGHSIFHPTNGRVYSRQGSLEPAMISAVTSILRSIGEDPLRKELLATPYSFVQWLMRFKRSTFEMKLNGLNNDTLDLHSNGVIRDDKNVIHYELNLPFCAQCEHHLLPFHGVVHIGCFQTEESEAFDRSVLQSIVHFYGCKLQVQERLTRQIAEAVSSLFGRDVMVVVEANHICMVSRGIEKIGSSTATVAVLGQFSTDPSAKALFLQSISETAASGR